jgi:hypothetical protein
MARAAPYAQPLDSPVFRPTVGAGADEATRCARRLVERLGIARSSVRAHQFMQRLLQGQANAKGSRFPNVRSTRLLDVRHGRLSR